MHQNDRLDLSNPSPDTEAIDGGVQTCVDSTAPKCIRSTALVRFSCTTSCLAADENEVLSGRVYTLTAHLQNGVVHGRYDDYDRYGKAQAGTFEADGTFMDAVQAIVSAHDLAAHNGCYCRVSGLPDNYGASLSAIYDSGEQIDAADNETNFLPPAATRALVSLFADHAAGVTSPFEAND